VAVAGYERRICNTHQRDRAVSLSELEWSHMAARNRAPHRAAQPEAVHGCSFTVVAHPRLSSAATISSAIAAAQQCSCARLTSEAGRLTEWSCTQAEKAERVPPCRPLPPPARSARRRGTQIERQKLRGEKNEPARGDLIRVRGLERWNGWSGVHCGRPPKGERGEQKKRRHRLDSA